MKKTMVKILGLTALMFVAIMFIRTPENVSAAEYDENIENDMSIEAVSNNLPDLEDDLYVATRINLDDSHWVDVYAWVHVYYTYDEGVQGIVYYAELDTSDGGIGSNTVNFDRLSPCEDEPGISTYKLVYYMDAHERENCWTGYIKINVNCNEWGELSIWVDYEPC
ncbi:MAG: hypothetical protein Q4F06_09635 [Eubacteriales bacterium]|nr:hypothetical protein [Eubacteriales bacterium]